MQPPCKPLKTWFLGRPKGASRPQSCKSAANLNERDGLVNHRQATDVARNEGVAVSEVDVAGNRIIRESVGEQVVAQYMEPQINTTAPAAVLDRDAITIAEALEATALSIGDKPVEQSDASAIQAAEVRATGTNEVQPGGVAATAQSTATYNARTMFEGGKTKISDVLVVIFGSLILVIIYYICFVT